MTADVVERTTAAIEAELHDAWSKLYHSTGGEYKSLRARINALATELPAYVLRDSQAAGTVRQPMYPVPPHKVQMIPLSPLGRWIAEKEKRERALREGAPKAKRAARQTHCPHCGGDLKAVAS